MSRLRLLGHEARPRRIARTIIARTRHAPLVRRVALAFPMETAHVQGIVRGIADFSDGRGAWRFTTIAEPIAQSMRLLSGWQGDGVIAALRTEADVRAASQLSERGIPCVNISSSGAEWKGLFPRVVFDNATIGRLAAEHFLNRGFRRFAYYGLRGVGYSDERERGFVERLGQEGISCDTHISPPMASEPRWGWADDAIALVARLNHAGLMHAGRPVGVFAANDQRARLVIEACAAEGIRVPDAVAVLGVDDDRPTCEAAQPPLSSIACDWRRLGYEAAAILDPLMDGRPVGSTTAFDSPVLDSGTVNPGKLIQPIGVVQRRSTDAVVIDSVCVTKAVEYVRSHLSEVFGVEAVLRASGMPRRSLELTFKRVLGCTPYQFITRARLARANELLAATPSQKLSDIAKACGFADLRRFRLVFRREFGMSPAEQRRRCSGAAG